VATAPITWGQSATLAGAGALVGSSSFAWGQTGVLRGDAPLAGSAGITWSQTATLAGAAALAGTAPIVWTATGTGALIGGGTAAILFAATGTIADLRVAGDALVAITSDAAELSILRADVVVQFSETPVIVDVVRDELAIVISADRLEVEIA